MSFESTNLYIHNIGNRDAYISISCGNIGMATHDHIREAII